MRGLLFVIAVFFVALWNLALPSPKASAVDPAMLKEQLAEVESLEALHARLLLVEASDKEQYKEIDELRNKVDAITASVAELSKPVAKVEPVKPAPVVKVETPRVSVAVGGYSQPDGYKSQWTYPGDIATHVSTVHGISAAGKSKEQLEKEHDAAHNATRVAVSTRSVVVATPYVQRSVTRSVTSNCPGGVCPTRTSVQVQVRRPLLLWRR